MAIIEPKGLKGLKSFEDLSIDEQSDFIKKNKALLSRFTNRQDYLKAASHLYENRKFIDTFGKKVFDKYNDNTERTYNLRSEYLKNYLINKNFVDTFGGKDGDYNFNQLNEELDTQGKLDLLTKYSENQYLGTKRISELAKGDFAAAKEIKDQAKESMNSPYIDDLAKSYGIQNQQGALQRAIGAKEDREEDDKQIREKLFAETQTRREDEVQPYADALYQGILKNDSSGKFSLAQTYKQMDKTFTALSNHYAQFKNSKWLKDYSNVDKLKDYAKYTALRQRYGDRIAASYLDRTIQNRVADAQNGKFTGNTLKKFTTNTISTIGMDYSQLRHTDDYFDLKNLDRNIAVRNQGKDPNRPIWKNVNGKMQIVDYQKDEDWFWSPAYWNDVYQFNTFDRNEIKTIKERGGVSPYLNIREYGHIPDFVSWETFQEAFAQSGNALGSYIATAPIDLVSGGVSKGISMALKAAGRSLATIKRVEQVMSTANKIAKTYTAAGSDSGFEAMGTFQEQLLKNREKIQNQIERELRDYQSKINYNTPEAKKAINRYFKQLKAADQKRVRATKDSNTKQFPLSDELLYEQAKQQYMNKLSQAKYKELQDIHALDDLKAQDNAGATYIVNYGLNHIKNCALDFGIQSFKLYKGLKLHYKDNEIANDLLSDAATGGTKARNYLAKSSLLKQLGKQTGAGFWDEYQDGINAAFAQGIGDNMFQNYIDKTYNPKDYQQIRDNVMANYLSGVHEGIKGFADRENYYEGTIGALGSAVTISPNLSTGMGLATADARNALFHGKDNEGNNLSTSERISQVITNPLIGVYAEAHAKQKAANAASSAVNKIIDENKETLQSVSTLLGASKINDDNNETSDTPIQDKDSKMYKAFTLMDALNKLQNTPGGENAQLYKDVMTTLQGLSDGTLSNKSLENEISKVLADNNNKSLLDEEDGGKSTAAKRLQKNAAYLLKVKKQIDSIYDQFDNSRTLQNINPEVKKMLAYNLVQSDNFKERLQDLEKQLDLSYTDADRTYNQDFRSRYGTSASRAAALQVRERTINDIESQIADVEKQKEKAEEQGKKLLEDRANTQDEKQISKIDEEIQKNENLKTALNFHQKALQENKKQVERERDQLSQYNKEQEQNENASQGTSTLNLNNVLLENEILNLDARDRAFMLNPDNLKNFSEEQQEIIKRTVANLQEKDPDALEKIKDAGTLAQRISDLKTVQQKIRKNDALAELYLDTVKTKRDNIAYQEALQQQIDAHFKDLEDAYETRDKEPNAFMQKAKMLSSAALQVYIDQHPEQKEEATKALDYVKFAENAAFVIKYGDFTDQERQELSNILNTTYLAFNSEKDFRNVLEAFIKREGSDENEKQAITKFLKQLDDLKDSHDNDNQNRTNREKANKKEQERKNKEKIKEEERKKKEAERKAKEAAKKAAEEAKKKEQEEENEEEEEEDDDDSSLKTKTDKINKLEEKLEKLSEQYDVTNDHGKLKIVNKATGEDMTARFTITSTPGGWTWLTAVDKDNPLWNVITDKFEDNSTETRWGEQEGFTYYYNELSGRGGEHVAIWFKDKPTEFQKRLIEKVLYEEGRNIRFFDERAHITYPAWEKNAVLISIILNKPNTVAKLLEKYLDIKIEKGETKSEESDKSEEHYDEKTEKARQHVLKRLNQLFSNIKEIEDRKAKGQDKAVTFNDGFKVPQSNLDLINVLHKITSNLQAAQERGINTDTLLNKEQKEKYNSLKKELKDKGYSWEDTIKKGQAYNEGMNPTADFETDTNLAAGEQIISLVKTPQINFNGRMVQAADIKVKQSPWESQEEKEEYQKAQQAFSQLIEQLNKIGIKVHNKKELNAFLKENGADSIEAYIRKRPYIKFRSKEDAAIVGSNLMSRYTTNTIHGVVSRSANVWYLCDYFGNKEVRPIASFTIKGTEDLLQYIEQKIKDENFKDAGALNRRIKAIKSEYRASLREHTNDMSDVKKGEFDHGISGLDKSISGEGNLSKQGEDNEQSLRDLQEGRHSDVEELRTSDGTLYGFVHNGEIYIDEDKINFETPLHEYTHLWDKAIQKTNPSLWKRGKQLMKEGAKNLWKEISESENYGEKWRKQGLSEDKVDDLIASEVHSRLTGKEGDRILKKILEKGGNEGVVQKLKNWLQRFWKELCNNFDAWKTQDVEKLKLMDFARLPMIDFVKGINPINITVEDNGTVKMESKTVEEQASDLTQEGVTLYTADVNQNASTEPADTQKSDTDPSLYGNAMPEYELSDLVNSGTLKRKKGRHPDDNMSRYYNWLRASGIHLQNIIDNELGDILEANPGLKVKFMSVIPRDNATHDFHMQTHLMLVVDYDDKINKDITKIHNDENGGVIESNGKKYLIIGTAGYGNAFNKNKKARYDILFSNNPHIKPGYGKIKANRMKFANSHPNERFYVEEGFSTEIIPGSLTMGNIVKRLEKDKNTEYRTLKELLEDKERNPHNYTYKDIILAILTRSSFYSSESVPVIPPRTRNEEDLAGDTYLLLKTGTGMYIPLYIKPLMYNEIKDGELKNRLNAAIDDLISSDYSVRMQALRTLLGYLFLRGDKDAIYNNENPNSISFVKNGQVFKSFDFRDTVSKEDIYEAIQELNPRINITLHGIADVDMIKLWDEAGALTTDLAMLGTVGSLYKIYSVDENGKMEKPEEEPSYFPVGNNNGNSDFRLEKARQIPYRGKYYIYKKDSGNYYLNGEIITDKKLLQQLYYNLYAIEHKEAVERIATNKYVVIDDNPNNPLVVKINTASKEATELSKEDANKYLKEKKERIEQKERERKAAEALRKEKENKEKKKKPENTGINEEYDYNKDLWDAVMALKNAENAKIEELFRQQMDVDTAEAMDKTREENEEKKAKKGNNTIPPTKVSPPSVDDSNTITFEQMMKSQNIRTIFISTIYKKWPNAPKGMKKLKEFLKKQGVQVDTIPAGKEGFKAWLDNIINCR